MFALVRYLCNGKIKPVSVEFIGVCRKENGVKIFEPFEPTCATDFMNSETFKKYAVFKKHKDGLVRRWYVVICRLGASPEEVLGQSSEPAPKTVNESQPTIHTPGDSFNPIFSRTVNKHDHGSESTNNPKTQDEQKAASSKETNITKFTQTDAQAWPIAEKFKELRNMEERLEKAKIMCDMSEKKLLQATENAFNILLTRLDNTSKDALQRVSAVEKLVFSFIDQIKDSANMAHVHEWVNSIPANIPEIISEGALDVARGVDTPENMLKHALGNKSGAMYTLEAALGDIPPQNNAIIEEEQEETVLPENASDTSEVCPDVTEKSCSKFDFFDVSLH